MKKRWQVWAIKFPKGLDGTVVYGRTYNLNSVLLNINFKSL